MFPLVGVKLMPAGSDTSKVVAVWHRLLVGFNLPLWDALLY